MHYFRRKCTALIWLQVSSHIWAVSGPPLLAESGLAYLVMNRAALIWDEGELPIFGLEGGRPHLGGKRAAILWAESGLPIFVLE